MNFKLIVLLFLSKHRKAIKGAIVLAVIYEIYLRWHGYHSGLFNNFIYLCILSLAFCSYLYSYHRFKMNKKHCDDVMNSFNKYLKENAEFYTIEKKGVTPRYTEVYTRANTALDHLISNSGMDKIEDKKVEELILKYKTIKGI